MLRVLEGAALHAGGRTTVTLRSAAGPVRFVRGAESARFDELAPTRTDRGVRVRSHDGAIEIDLVEHLLAAFGGLGVHEGVTIEVEGPEVPLLDGGARAFADALCDLDAAPTEPALFVAEHGEVRVGASTYVFRPGDATCVTVDVAFRAPVGRHVACWGGDPRDFRERIAPARTFGWRDEIDALRRTGRARSVDLASVVVFEPDGSCASPRPGEPTEPARHKLLDAIGDLALHGGPPRGSVFARLPGHTATHAAVAEALARGILARSSA